MPTHLEVDLPAVYVLRHRHVLAAFDAIARDSGQEDSGAAVNQQTLLTVWLHHSTNGIAEG